MLHRLEITDEVRTFLLDAHPSCRHCEDPSTRVGVEPHARARVETGAWLYADDAHGLCDACDPADLVCEAIAGAWV